MESPTDFFRKTLKEFRAADELLSKRLNSAEVTASAEQAETTGNAEAAKRAAAGYLKAIEANNSTPVNFDDIRISPQIEGDFSALKNLAASASENKKELEEINDRIKSLKNDLEKALSQEEREQQRLEWERQEALLKAEADRKKRKIRWCIIAAAAVCVLIILHFWLLNRTTLSFTVSVDGKPPSADRMPIVTLDGKPFSNGGKIGLGRHHFSVELKDFEPIGKDFWAFYGAKDLGALPLEFSKGSVNLLSDPADAEFELSGNGRQWQGKLPINIGGVPVGMYQLAIRRKGWELNQDVAVSRGSVTTNKTEFLYGSIEITSDPAGLTISTNGVEIGKTPMTLQEIRPGQYTVAVSDGENDLTADVSVGLKEAVKQPFLFHYGAVQLSSAPSGATVIRKGKEIGKTPLALNHIPAGETMIGLQLQDYVPTNFSIQAVEGVTTNLSVKLISEHYVQAMKQARESFDAGQFTDSQKFLTNALESEPNDPTAIELQSEVSQAIAKAEEARKEAERIAEINRKQAEHDEIVAIIEKAIAAAGGRDTINRFRSFKMVSHSSGKDHGSDFGLRATIYIQFPDEIRLDQQIDNPQKQLTIFGVNITTVTKDQGQPIQSTFCVAGNQSWEVTPGILGGFRPSAGKFVQEQLHMTLYVSECSTFIPLLGDDYTLEKLPDSPAMPFNAIGIKVHKSGKPDVTMYFDKDSGRLAGLDTQSVDNHGKVVPDIERYSDYRSFSGLMLPSLTKYVQDEKTYSTSTLESFEPFAQYYGNVFSPPQSLQR